MSDLFRFPNAVSGAPEVDLWFGQPDHEMRRLARPWFELMRASGPDVREVMADGHPVACVEDAAFAYVDAFTSHVNIGFYQGASLPDPAGLLEGAGKRMRHVKVRWGVPVNEPALAGLIASASRDMRTRVRAERGGI